jgi:hypothetical protein
MADASATQTTPIRPEMQTCIDVCLDCARLCEETLLLRDCIVMRQGPGRPVREASRRSCQRTVTRGGSA